MPHTRGSADDTSDPSPVLDFSQLFRYSTRFELFIDVLGIVAAVAAGAAQPLMSIIFANLTQSFVTFGVAESIYMQDTGNATALQQFHTSAAQFRHNAWSISLYMVYIGLGVLVCTYVSMVIWVYTGEVNAKRIREKYLQAVLRQDVAYFDTVAAGEVTTRILTDTHLVQQAMSEKVVLVVNYLSAFVTGFTLAYVRCWRLALAMSFILPCLAFTGTIMSFFITKNMQFSLKHIAAGSTLAEEVISTIRTAQAFGSQKLLSNIYDMHVQQAVAFDTKSAIVHGSGVGIFFFIMYFSYGLAFQFGTTLINEGYATAGDVVNVVFAILIGSFSLALMAPEFLAVNRGRGAAAKLFATIERVPNIDSSNPDGFKPKNVLGEITLEDVKFDYPSRPDVSIIGGINVTFTAGQTAALVGASGSGKSTIISLIERFYDPVNGCVKLDGMDIRTLNVKWLRSQIGLVLQEPTLFATTVRDNVAHGLINTPHEHCSEEEKLELIKEACVKANAHDFVCNLPDGYDTMVGERGFLLSGGQKQRIAIARAIVSDPRILLLDEATSALDTQSEGVVQDALEKASAGRTTITIAHRLSTIKNVDCIYVMGDGLILEKGTHKELLANENGAYSRLVRAQKLRDTHTTGLTTQWGEKATQLQDSLFSKEYSYSSTSDLIQTKKDEERQPEIDDGAYSLPHLVMRIGQFHRKELWRYVVGSMFAIITGMDYPVFSIIYGHGINGFTQTDPAVRRNDGNMNAIWFLVIAVIVGFTNTFQNYLFASSAAILASNLRSLSFKAILRQDIEYFDKDENNTGSLTANLSDDPAKIHGMTGVALGTIVQSISTVIGGLIIALFYAYKAALVGMACIPFLLATGYVQLRVIILKDQQNKRAHASSSQLACEAVASIRTVASLTREEDCLRLYSECLEEPLRRSNKVSRWSNLLYAFSQSSSFLAIALVFWRGADLVSRLEISIMSFFVVLIATTLGMLQAGNILSHVPDLSPVRNAAAAIVKLIDSTPEIDAESTKGDMLEGNVVEGQIEFESVCFRYPTRPGVPVIQDLSFKVEPGTYVALVGASGCGKSTIIQLVERFYNPLSGKIRLDGKPINELNIQDYRKQISLVSQEPTLYAGTIRFNILLGAAKPESEVTQEEIEAVCRDANILSFIQSLPDGFDTQVGGKGSQLSGGQKQRIAIARALLRNPKVLLLDEATSALDSSSEKIVQDALDRAARGRTTIAIAHRLSTIQNADCIYFIKEGRISEAGAHDELLSLRGDYYAYAQLQALSTRY